MKQSWFTMRPEQEVCVRTATGTVPGTPLADLLYEEVQTIFLDGLRRRLDEHGLTACAIHSSVKAPAPCWADDVAVLLPYCTASEVVPNLKTIAHEADKLSRDTGVLLNFDPGKSEALLLFHGKDSLAMSRNYLTKDEPAVEVALCSGDTISLRLVRQYEHLGGRVVHTGACLSDIKKRTRLTEGTSKQLSRTLLRNPVLEHEEKVLLLNSLVINKLLFGAGLWCLENSEEERALHSAVMSFYRRSLRPIFGLSPKHLCDAEVCCLLSVLNPRQLHCVALIRQLRVVALQGPGFLWEALCEAHAWLRAAFDALSHVLAVLAVDWQLEAGWKDRLVQLQQRVLQLQRLPKQFKRAVLKSSLDKREDVLFKALDLRIIERNHELIFKVPDTATAGELECLHCKGKFKTKAALAAHNARRHGIQAASTRLAYGTRCERCSVEFWSTRRLRRHLSCVAECRACYEGADLTCSEVFTTDVSAWRPPAVTLGPRPFWTCFSPELPNPSEAALVGTSSAAARTLLELIGTCGSSTSVEQFFRSVLVWVCRFGGETEGVVCYLRHPWLDLIELASLLQASNFVTTEDGVRVGKYSAVADGCNIRLCIKEV